MERRFEVVLRPRAFALNRRAFSFVLISGQVFVALVLVMLWLATATLYIGMLVGMDEGMLEIYIIMLGFFTAVVACNPFSLRWLLNSLWVDRTQARNAEPETDDVENRAANATA